MAACVLLTLALRRPAPAFVYDAAQYWAGATALVDGGDVLTAGGLGVRGALTAVVYAPAVALSQGLGSSAGAAGWAVLVQNALMLALLGAVVAPRLIGRIVALRPAHVAVCGSLTVLTLSGFAPYPMMDVPALLLIFAGIDLVLRTSPLPLVLGGALLAVGSNLRPSYVLPVVLVAACTLLLLRWRVVFVVGGAAAGLAPQVWYGLSRADVWSVLPPQAGVISAIQVRYAAFGTRYDTVYLAGEPRQWYCDAEMAAATATAPPTSNGDLLRLFVDQLPGSALFSTEKVAASLQWSWATPYAGEGTESLRVMAMVCTLVACAGLVSLIAMMGRAGSPRRASLLLLAMVAGCLVTMVGSAPETRFAAPIVVAGLVGSVAYLGTQNAARSAETRPGRRRHASRSALPVAAPIAAAAVSVAVLVLGANAMADPLPRGDLTPEICQADG